MQGVFEYRDLTAELVEEIALHALEGKTTVILGPPFVGKSLLGKKLKEALEKRKKSVVDVPLWSLPEAANERELIDLFKKSLGVEGEFDSLSELLKSCADARPVIYVSGLDKVSQTLARSILTEVRAYNQLSPSGIVFCGESSLQELVFGPNSAIDCSEQIVIQGLGKDYFVDQVNAYAKALGVELSRDAGAELCEMVGGNTYLMRLAIWALIEYRTRGGTVPNAITVTDIRSALANTGVLTEHAPFILRTFLRLIPLEKIVWPYLESMLAGEMPSLKLPESNPRALTLGGIAKRRDGKVYWASPVMERLAKDHFSGTAMADLYAAAGDWQEAFNRYKTFPRTPRPSNAKDIPDTDAVIHSLCASIETEASKGPAYTEQLLIVGCRRILGFEDVFVWEKDSGWEKDSSWDLDCAATRSEMPSEMSDLLETLAKTADTRPRGAFDLPEPWKRAGTCWVLPSVRRAGNSLFLAGDLHSKASIAQERLKLFDKLLSTLERERTPRTHYSEPTVSASAAAITAGLNKALDCEPREVLKAAAAQLRKVYRRVLFCLVDPKGEQIQGIWDDSDDSTVNVAEMTDFHIVRDRDKDVQPWVVYNKKTKVIEKAEDDALANPLVVKAAKLKGIAVVPMMDFEERAIGTMHVERPDGAPPDNDQIQALEKFGREIAIILEENKRLRLLQSTLDRLADPILIADASGRRVYTNLPAATLLDISHGWTTGTAHTPAVFADSISEALDGKRANKHFRVDTNKLTYRGSVKADCLLDTEKRVIGAFADVHNQNDLFEIFEILGNIVAAHNQEDVLKRVLAALERLGHKWARLYVVADEPDPRLIGKHSFGFFSDESVRDEFNRGLIHLLPRTVNPISWRSLDSKQSVVFRRAQRGEPCKKLNTPLGLEVEVVDEECDERLKKQPGDYWLDFPLFVGSGELGKITLQCAEDLRPERLELLDILSQLVGMILDAIQARELADREQTIQRAAEKSISVVSHNVATRFAGLAILLSRYRTREKKYPEIKKLNDAFADAYQAMIAELDHVKEMFRGASAYRVDIEIETLLKENLLAWLNPGQYKVTVDRVVSTIRADPRLLSGIINELCKNSLDANDKDRLQVCVAVGLVGRNVRIVYRDNGPGIPANLKERIFDDFFTLRATGSTGTGLGLTYVKKAVQAHGGRVYEDGNPIKGARFVIEFPRDDIRKE